MIDNTIHPDTIHPETITGETGQPIHKNKLAHVGDADADTTGGAQANLLAKPETLAKTVKGQKYVAPSGRHSQQSHRRAQERAEAQGNTSQEQHDHDRDAVKTEVSRVAALHSTQKSNPAK